MTSNSYIDDLLDRMESKEKLPVLPGERSMSSTHSFSFMAHAEAREVSDVRLLPQLESALKSMSPRPRYRKAIYILGHLAGNSNDSDCIQLFLNQFRRKGLKNQEHAALLGTAAQAKVEIPKEDVEYCLNIRNGDVLYEAIEYCGSLQATSCVKKICEVLEQDCYHLTEPFFAAIALGKIGSSDALLVLERTIERHECGKKQENIDAAHFSREAIKKIKEADQGSGGNG